MTWKILLKQPVTGVASGSDHYIKRRHLLRLDYVTYTVKRMKEMTTGNYVRHLRRKLRCARFITSFDVTYQVCAHNYKDLSLKVTADMARY